MFLNLAAALVVTVMAVNSASSTPLSNEQKQVDAMDKMETVSALVDSKMPSANFTVENLKKEVVKVASPGNLNDWFSQYSQQYGADENLLKKIAACESGFNASSDSGTYGGMFQYAVSTWQSTRAAMGLDQNPDLRFNAEEAIKTSAFKVAHGGASSWPVCSK